MVMLLLRWLSMPALTTIFHTAAAAIANIAGEETVKTCFIAVVDILVKSQNSPLEQQVWNSIKEKLNGKASG